jgi:hypothetical protein
MSETEIKLQRPRVNEFSARYEQLIGKGFAG